ncbi:MAG: quinol:cytochrome C oxidoreductase [Bacteroidia bacterium]
MGHHREVQIREEKFEFTDKAKRFTFMLMGIGILFALIGYLTYHPAEHELVLKRFLASILFNAYFFFIIAACSILFIAISQIANAGWYVAIRRIPEAISRFMPIGAGVIILILIFFLPTLYHWAHHGVMETDPTLMKKTWYLNKPFFYFRVIAFPAFWIWVALKIRNYSQNEDEVGGLVNFDKSFRISAAFVLIFAFTFSMFAWDVAMSIDAHWYSTIFTIYNFATGWVSALTAIYLLLWFLRSNGYLKDVVTDEHQHDLGKFMFAFSVFWTYMWTAQFVLIWYANIPEEVAYYRDRLWGSYKFYFYFNLFMNFIIPFFLFMKRSSKRNKTMGIFVGTCILIGHWNDVYLMVMPGALNIAAEITEHNPTGIIETPSQGIGFMEIGFLCLFAGLFLFMTLAGLAKANLYPTKHPYIIESALHDTGV